MTIKTITSSTPVKPTPVTASSIHVKSKTPPVKKAPLKHKIKKAKKRRELAVLKDRVMIAEMEVAKAIMHLKFHEIQLAKHTKDQKYPSLVEGYKDAKDTYERLMKRAAFPHKKGSK